MSTVKEIRPSLGFAQMLDADLLTRATAIQAQMAGNAAYPNPPVDAGALKAAIDRYAEAISAALDGSRKAKADRRRHRSELIAKLRLLGHYVEATCNADMAVFLSSGFLPTSSERTVAQPLSPPEVLRIEQGNTGQLLVRIKPLRGARTYELRYAAANNGHVPVNWTTTIVLNLRYPAAINSLTPGVIYVFQVRAVNRAGYTDWSGSVSRMCI